MKIKTYGIYGLTEWVGKVKVGTIEVELTFKGGTSSPSGTQPAYMVTKDPITQFVIENCVKFKNGFICLVKSQELPGADRRIATPKTVKADAEPVKAESATDDAGAEAEQTVTELEFDCNDEAKDYLERTFGVQRSKLRSRADIVAYGNANGVSITFSN